MNGLQIGRLKSVLLATVIAGSLFLPLPSGLAWLIFAALLLAASIYSHRCLNAGQASLVLGTVLGVAAFSASKSPKAALEFTVLFMSSTLLLTGALLTLFAKTRVAIANGPGGPDEARIKPTQKTRPTTGEVLMQRQQAMKRNLPAPQFVQPIWPHDFRTIAGMDEFKAKLRSAGFECAGPEDRNGILLHGEPGNGKTVFAQALAGELGLEFIAIRQKKFKWLGEESIHLFNQLNEAISRAPCVVFLDEAETILGVRDDTPTPGMSGERNAIVNRMLTLLVEQRQRGIVFVAATNFVDSIDTAIRRPGRFDFVFEVPNPDLKARSGLIRLAIAKNAPGFAVQRAVVESLAKRWNGFNTATILAIPAQIPQYLKDTGKRALEFEDFMAMHRRQQGIANRVSEDTKSLKDMSYQQEQGDAIRHLIARMDQAFEIEESGGTAPSGVLFYGDPGTGKTETARMIAKETKWAFFPVAGPDLARNPDLIEQVLKKVRNTRPAIIFIDEADDLLGDRSTNSYKAATNKLLEAMDGANGRMSDLLWIASTNFVEDSDAAIIRSGRFTEKIRFFKPGEDSLLAFAKEFFTDPKRSAVLQVTWGDIAQVLEGCSIADAQGILMQAWNLTLTSRGGVDRSHPVTLESLKKARAMLGIH